MCLPNRILAQRQAGQDAEILGNFRAFARAIPMGSERSRLAGHCD